MRISVAGGPWIAADRAVVALLAVVGQTATGRAVSGRVRYALAVVLVLHIASVPSHTIAVRNAVSTVLTDEGCQGAGWGRRGQVRTGSRVRAGCSGSRRRGRSDGQRDRSEGRHRAGQGAGGPIKAGGQRADRRSGRLRALRVVRAAAALRAGVAAVGRRAALAREVADAEAVAAVLGRVRHALAVVRTLHVALVPSHAVAVLRAVAAVLADGGGEQAAVVAAGAGRGRGGGRGWGGGGERGRQGLRDRQEAVGLQAVGRLGLGALGELLAVAGGAGIAADGGRAALPAVVRQTCGAVAVLGRVRQTLAVELVHHIAFVARHAVAVCPAIAAVRADFQ